ncbi:MAG: thiamine-monophosphate kinase, partial [Gammaproteobacteria bacterium]
DDAAELMAPASPLISVVSTCSGDMTNDPQLCALTLAQQCQSQLDTENARGHWMTLALTLPRPDQNWLEGFSGALHQFACNASWQLIGGDTTHGPACITLTVHGTSKASTTDPRI